MIDIEAETQEEGEAGSMQKPDVGLDPRSPGSCPGLQAALNRCATRAAPNRVFLPLFVSKHFSFCDISCHLRT